MAVRRAAVGWAAALVVSGGLLALPLVALAATSSVNIQNSAFAPATMTVRVGDTVTWTNRDAFSHTSTSDTGTWDTGVIRAGAASSFTFTAAGTFAYHCAIHSFMHGTIVVQAVTTPQPTAPPTAPPTPVRTSPPTIAPTPTTAATEAPTAQATTGRHAHCYGAAMTFPPLGQASRQQPLTNPIDRSHEWALIAFLQILADFHQVHA